MGKNWLHGTFSNHVFDRSMELFNIKSQCYQENTTKVVCSSTGCTYTTAVISSVFRVLGLIKPMLIVLLAMIWDTSQSPIYRWIFKPKIQLISRVKLVHSCVHFFKQVANTTGKSSLTKLKKKCNSSFCDS